MNNGRMGCVGSLAVLFLVGAACTAGESVTDAPSLEDAGGDSSAPHVEDAGGFDAPVDRAGEDPDGSAVANLWVYTTSASFGGDFAGADNGRSAADDACTAMHDATYTHRNCSHFHAILQTDNSTDTLARMGDRFSIPSNVPVLRALDEAKVAYRWDDVVNPNMQLIETIAPVAPDPLYVWTGRGMNADRQCEGWSSRSTGLFGDAGNAAKRKLWFVDGSFRCDNITPKLACVCW